ncbi:Sigma-70 region 2 [Nannocystis exedens]|uniref:Sigma-70 region 2 n=1 Tax=Nannocystis exedens TaxID=54 RepID=A0A1I2J1R4_9BACT|nr:sigma factor [Nannocystis exedens]PCC67172.1 RNA polymerase sigma factor SigA2 [Nannocystis exedens]SFF47950.1 Sigma-70 region 2 [Nannocystis exedens]
MWRHEPTSVAVRCFELRAELWRALLGQPAALAWVAELARRLLHPELRPEGPLQRLEAAAEALAGSDGLGARAAYEAARRAAADALGPADPDRCLARRLVADILAHRSALLVEPAILRWSTVVQRRQAALDAALNLLRARDEQIGRLVRALRPPGRSCAELVAVASQGLQWAVGRYDPRRGVRFDRFAEWWIRHMIRRLLAPPSAPGPRPRTELRSTHGQFITLHGRPPTEEELMALTGEPLEQVRLARGLDTRHRYARETREKGTDDAPA